MSGSDIHQTELQEYFDRNGVDQSKFPRKPKFYPAIIVLAVIIVVGLIILFYGI